MNIKAIWLCFSNRKLPVKDQNQLRTIQQTLQLQIRRKEENFITFYYISIQNRHANEIETHLFPACCVLYWTKIFTGNKSFVRFVSARKRKNRTFNLLKKSKPEEEEEEEEQGEYSDESAGLIWENDFSLLFSHISVDGKS